MSSFPSVASNDCDTSIVVPNGFPSQLTETSDALSCATTRKRKYAERTRSAISTWEHTREPQGSEPVRSGKKNERVYYCKYCVNPFYSTLVSTTFRNHLLKEHHIELESAELHPIKKARDSLLKDAFAKAGKINTVRLQQHEEEALKSAINPRAAIEALVQLITVHNLPYNCSQWPALHAFIMAINYTAEGLIKLSHGSLQKLVSNSYFIHKDILRKKLQAAISKLHFSVDVWSAPNHKAFLGVCVQFVDLDTKICQALLALQELPGLDGPGSHGGAEQWKLLKPTLIDYGIYHKIGFVTGDNHGSNDVLCRLLGQFLKEKGIDWSAKQNRIRCHGHVTNLACQAFLFCETKEAVEAACKDMEALDGVDYNPDMIAEWRKKMSLGWREMGPLGKAHNTAIHIRGDDYRYNLFKKRAGRVLKLDNDTRWNSWFLLLEVVLEKQDYVEWYQRKYYDDLKDDYISPKDWETLKETRAFLQPFWRITQLTESYNTTLDRTLFTMDVLSKHYQQAFEKYKDNQELLGCVLTSWFVFDKYYQKVDESPAYSAALILHPSRRKQHILKNWPKDWHRQAFNDVKKYWEDHYKGLPTIEQTPLFMQEVQQDEYDLLAQELDVVSAIIDADEYDTYISHTPIPIDCSPLQWWLRDEQQQRYPRLSKMAIDILSIPAMSADPERVFSGARRTISWERIQLGASTIERGECLKSWIRSGITQGLPLEVVEQFLEESVGPTPTLSQEGGYR